MTNISGNTNNKKENLIDEYKIIQQNIQKWDKYSLIVKNWAITTWAILLVLISTQYYELKSISSNLSYLFFIPLFILFPFWIFDAFLKRFQRCTIARSEAIQDYLNNSIEELNKLQKSKVKKELKKQKNNSIKVEEVRKKFIDEFPIFDSMCRISQKYEFFRIKYLKNPINENFNKNSFLACFFVRIVSVIYSILIILTVIIKFIICNDFVLLSKFFSFVNIIFLFVLIIALIIAILAYIFSEKAII